MVDRPGQEKSNYLIGTTLPLPLQVCLGAGLPLQDRGEDDIFNHLEMYRKKVKKKKRRRKKN